jgi:hypothetical protein
MRSRSRAAARLRLVDIALAVAARPGLLPAASACHVDAPNRAEQSEIHPAGRTTA